MKISKEILKRELFVYNKKFNLIIDASQYYDFFSFQNNKIKILDKNLEKIIKKIKDNITKINTNYLKEDKKDKKLRSFGIISIFIFILGKYLEFLGQFNKKSKSFNNYKFNKLRDYLLNDLNIQKFILDTEIVDIVLFYQLNNGFLNYPFFKRLYSVGEKYLIYPSFSNNNHNGYNLFFISYSDFQKSEINKDMLEIIDYFEKNKERLFYKRFEKILQKFALKDLVLIKEKIKKEKEKKGIKENQFWLYFGDEIKEEFLKVIFEEINNKNLQEHLQKNKIEIIKKEDLDKIYFKILKELVRKTNLFLLKKNN